MRMVDALRTSHGLRCQQILHLQMGRGSDHALRRDRRWTSLLWHARRLPACIL
jgi:hypothetical protein